jgi:hypothetical protein
VPVEVLSGSGYSICLIWPPGLQVPTTSGALTGVDGYSGSSPCFVERRHTAGADRWNATGSGDQIAAGAAPPSGGTIAVGWQFPAIAAGRKTGRPRGQVGYAFIPSAQIGAGSADRSVSYSDSYSPYPRVLRTFTIGAGYVTTAIVDGMRVTIMGTDHDGSAIYSGPPVILSGGAAFAIYLDQITPAMPAGGSPRVTIEDGDATAWVWSKGRSVILHPLAGISSFYRGADVVNLAMQVTGTKASPFSRYVLAPKVSTNAPDFAVDADCPAPWGNVRVVWASGYPILTARTPTADATVRHAHRRTTKNLLHQTSSGSTWGIEHPPRVVLSGENHHPVMGANATWLGGGTYPQTLWVRGDKRITYDLFPPDVFLATDKSATASVAITSATAQWYAIDNGETLGAAVGSPVTMTCARYPVTPSTGLSVYARFDGQNIGMPPDLGPLPRRLGVKVTIEYTAYATSSMGSQYSATATWTAVSNTQLRPYDIGALPYWPFDLPRLALAPDDGTCAYVGQEGWRHADESQPVAVTWTAPTLTRTATTLSVATHAAASRTGPEYGPILTDVNYQAVAFCPTTGQGFPGLASATWTIPVESRPYPIVVRYVRVFTQFSTIGGWLTFSRQWDFTV